MKFRFISFIIYIFCYEKTTNGSEFGFCSHLSIKEYNNLAEKYHNGILISNTVSILVFIIDFLPYRDRCTENTATKTENTEFFFHGKIGTGTGKR
jgi:hypothetical protein